MSELDETIRTEKPQKRPVFLSVLCILTFITVGFGLLGVLLSALGGKPTPEEVEQANTFLIQMANDFRGQNPDASKILEKSMDIQAYFYASFWSHLFVQTIAFGSGLVGAIFMWKGKRLGFHLYIIYSLISSFMIYLFVPSSEADMLFVAPTFVLSIIFIFLYAINLKWMKH